MKDNTPMYWTSVEPNDSSLESLYKGKGRAMELSDKAQYPGSFFNLVD